MELWPSYGLEPGTPIDPSSLFGGRPTIVEIGFGMGDATAVMADADPSVGVVAVDVHTPGVARLMRLVAEQNLDNVRVAHTDALDLVAYHVPAASLSGFRILFPDPWPKRRHQHRRLVRPDVVDLLVTRLIVGGTIHVATDCADYAGAMRAIFEVHGELVDSGPGFIARPTWRPVTRFEQRAIDTGHPTWELVFRRVDRTMTPSERS